MICHGVKRASRALRSLTKRERESGFPRTILEIQNSSTRRTCLGRISSWSRFESLGAHLRPFPARGRFPVDLVEHRGDSLEFDGSGSAAECTRFPPAVRRAAPPTREARDEETNRVPLSHDSSFYLLLAWLDAQPRLPSIRLPRDALRLEIGVSAIPTRSLATVAVLESRSQTRRRGRERCNDEPPRCRSSNACLREKPKTQKRERDYPLD